MLLVCGGYWFVCTQEWLPLKDLFFHPVIVSTSGFSRWLLGTWPGVEVFLATYRKVESQFLYRLNK